MVNEGYRYCYDTVYCKLQNLNLSPQKTGERELTTKMGIVRVVNDNCIDSQQNLPLRAWFGKAVCDWVCFIDSINYTTYCIKMTDLLHYVATHTIQYRQDKHGITLGLLPIKEVKDLITIF